MENKSIYSSLFFRYKNRGVIIDTNILLLFVVGSYRPDLVQRFKKTKNNYTAHDFQLIQTLVRHFSKIVVLPNILTEISNLLNSLDETQRKEVMSLLPRHFEIWEERYCPSFDASRWKHFHPFGLTDSCIALLAEKKHLVITDDFPLYRLLLGLNVDVVNFNHIRNLSLA
jgi:rRNA-processing protein FCF1